MISPAALCNFLTFEHPMLGTVAEFQAAQTAPGAVVLRVVPAAGFTAEAERALARALGALLGPDMAVRVEVVDGLPAAPSGKRRLVEGLPGP